MSLLQDVATNSFAVVNSLLVTLCVSGVVAMILVRSLKRDLLRYEEIDEMLGEGDDEDGSAAYEDFGWKVCKGREHYIYIYIYIFVVYTCV